MILETFVMLYILFYYSNKNKVGYRRIIIMMYVAYLMNERAFNAFAEQLK